MPPLYHSTRFCRDIQTPFYKPIRTHFILVIFLRLFGRKNPANSFSTFSIFTTITALFHFKTKIMAEQHSQFLIDEEKPMQKDPIYLCCDEDFETHYHISNENLTNDHDECWLSPVLIHPNDPTDIIEVTIPGVDLDILRLSHSATTNWQQDKNIHNVSPISGDIFLQPGSQSQINAVAQDLQYLPLNVHSEVQDKPLGLVCAANHMSKNSKKRPQNICNIQQKQVKQYVSDTSN